MPKPGNHSEFSSSRTLSRREALSRLGAAALAAGAFALPHSVRLALTAASSGVGDGFRADEYPLKDHATRKGLFYGSTTQHSILAGDPRFAGAFTSECGMLVPENELKWDVLRPTPDTYDFGPADWLMNFTQQHNIKMRGHTLAWNQALPKWFDSYANRGNARQLLHDHIETVVRRYAGRIHSWDVVNEVVEPNDKRSDGLRIKPWLNLLGPEYIDIAFHTAADADPNAILVWNEIHLEFGWAHANRDAIIGNLRDRIKRGVPIHALGLQSHLWASAPSYDNPEFVSFLRTISDMGLRIIITEMDVTDSDVQGSPAERDNLVAKTYYDYLSTVLRERAVVGVLTWGLSDRYTWLTKFRPRKDGGPVRPLPLDADMQRTPSWYAIAKAFDECQPR